MIYLFLMKGKIQHHISCVHRNLNIWNKNDEWRFSLTVVSCVCVLSPSQFWPCMRMCWSVQLLVALARAMLTATVTHTAGIHTSQYRTCVDLYLCLRVCISCTWVSYTGSTFPFVCLPAQIFMYARQWRCQTKSAWCRSTWSATCSPFNIHLFSPPVFLGAPSLPQRSYPRVMTSSISLSQAQSTWKEVPTTEC